MRLTTLLEANHATIQALGSKTAEQQRAEAAAAATAAAAAAEPAAAKPAAAGHNQAAILADRASVEQYMLRRSSFLRRHRRQPGA